jgi:UDP:flavonoid glycosyltransferase YjiC (YdhE family)
MLFDRARADLTPEENCRSWRRSIPFMRSGWHGVQVWRTEVLGLKAQSFREYFEEVRRTPHVLGYSPLLVPKPAEWGDWVTVTGSWFLKSDVRYEPPPELSEFLSSGEPPVVVGFGSHVSREPAALTKVILDALKLSGRRAILITAWGGLKCAEPPENVFCTAGVPYDWLLPRSLGLIHHGGAGTTAINLWAGVPQVVTPFGYDQTFWAHRVARLGVSSAPIPAKQLAAEDLAAAIREITTDDSIRSRAAAVGRAVRAENGVEHAVTVIEQIASLKEKSCARF